MSMVCIYAMCYSMNVMSSQDGMLMGIWISEYGERVTLL